MMEIAPGKKIRRGPGGWIRGAGASRSADTPMPGCRIHTRGTGSRAVPRGPIQDTPPRRDTEAHPRGLTEPFGKCPRADACRATCLISTRRVIDARRKAAKGPPTSYVGHRPRPHPEMAPSSRTTRRQDWKGRGGIGSAFPLCGTPLPLDRCAHFRSLVLGRLRFQVGSTDSARVLADPSRTPPSSARRSSPRPPR